MLLTSGLISRLLSERKLAAMQAGREFLETHSTDELLKLVGQRIKGISATDPEDKLVLPSCYGGGQPSQGEDYLVGKGLFYITEEGRLFLDCTSGHYQMVWGYNHPQLCRAVEEGQKAGIVWDNHSNIPQAPVKCLANRLVALANAPDGSHSIDKALIGICTGTSACAAALKMQLCSYQRSRGDKGPPIMVVLDGNYHGTDMFTQYLRGMWREYLTNLEVISVQPNDRGQLQNVFNQYGERIAAFWAEPVMMKREAILVEPDYLRLAGECCDAVGAALCIDEIQTGFWQPGILYSPSIGVKPDMIVVGKGMTAGFHPLSALLFNSKYDILEQYDALNTNGGAALASYVGLCCLDMVESVSEQIVSVGDQIMSGLSSLATQFNDRIQQTQGFRHLAGLKFRQVEDALDFHRRAVESGLWIRAHAYHQGHSTVLTKLGLLADEKIVDYMIAGFRSLLQN
ncbi:MAG: aminotransferase class III-fold pyridoxal phosphate-dependent enzyme [Planctomycetota bacterium]|nr:MAG: aminotransferase class III-fold pyridoxal phosphate-dependent enzyme [Planctomycetota bacterium]